MSGSESFCGNVSSRTITCFKWEIEKKYLLDKQVGEFLTSPIFHAFNEKCQARLFTRGKNKECKNYISLVLQLPNCTNLLKLQVVGKLVYDNGTIFTMLRRPNVVFPDTHQGIHLTAKKMCCYDSFIENYLNNGATTKFQFLIEFIPDKYARVPKPLNFGHALNNKQYSDIKFAVEGKIIYAHKIVLANKSTVFAAMFKHKMKENLKGEVEVNDVEYDVLLELFSYIYTGIVEDIEKIAKPLLVAADKYDLIDLKADCIKHIEKNITVDSVQDCLDLAERHNVDSLKSKAVEFIKSNASEMAQTPDVFKSIMESHPDVVIEVFQRLSAKKPRLE